MQTFTTRPEIRGTFGVVTSTHWIASAVGMSVLERGGNAFDAAVATGFALQIVEPHLNGPGGDLVGLVRPAGGPVEAICGQGVAPAAATIAAARAAGLAEMQGSGLFATVVPGAFDAWMMILKEFGTWEPADVLAPAIAYARDGHPVLPRVAATIEQMAPHFARDWPSSAELWCPGGVGPAPWGMLRNPILAETYGRLAGAAIGATRGERIEALRREWSEGFVARAVGDFLSGQAAFLTAADMAGWRASREVPAEIEYHGWTVSKTGPWGQGPVLLQALRILDRFDLGALDPLGAEFVHLVIEAMKLAYADREAYYGDPLHADVPLERLLSPDYAAERAGLITDLASLDQRPGRLPGFEAQADAAIARAGRRPGAEADGPQVGEPTMAHLAKKPGDTCHLDVIDAAGNAVSITPSGGWLQSSPAIPGLGFCLNSRAQMFWLDPASPSGLRPGARPRTTLTPSIAQHRDGRVMAFGTPGGDQQDQWQLVWFLRVVHHGFGLQEAVDAPLFHSLHWQGSFAPRVASPGEVVIEPGFGAAVLDGLRARGHRLTVSEPWSLGRLTAAARAPDGLLSAMATPRLMQAYAVGR